MTSELFAPIPHVEVKATLQTREVLPDLSGETMEIRLIRKRKVWQFPRERFVTYEQSDEEWCRFFGIGREVEVTDETAFQNAVVEELHCGPLGHCEIRFSSNATNRAGTPKVMS